MKQWEARLKLARMMAAKRDAERIAKDKLDEIREKFRRKL